MVRVLALDEIFYFQDIFSRDRRRHNDRFLARHGDYTFYGRDFGSDEFVIKEMLLEDTYGWFADPVSGGFVIDVGANIGSFSVVASENNRVFAYEPEINNIQFLQWNRAINHRDFAICQYAIGKPNTTSTIDNNNGGSTLGTGKQEVIVIGLDDIVTEEVDFLKMDCEGGEYDAFLYASPETLKKIKRFAMEVHADLTTPSIHREFIRILQEYFDIDQAVEHGRILGRRKQ